MSTLQISAPFAAGAAARRPSPVLRFFHAEVAAMAETNRHRAEREIARVARTYGLGADRT